MDWKTAERKLKALGGQDDRILREGIRILSSVTVSRHAYSLSEQPFDSLLLRKSRLFLKSRDLFLKLGGKFTATLVSSSRTLTSPILLTKEIEYTPIERELIWAAKDPIESSPRKHSQRLLQTRTLCTSLFHEQNHRILWNLLPPPSLEKREVTRYLNFMESLVVTLDMALGDELTPALSRVFYLSGVLYDPGTEIRTEIQKEKHPRRIYRNYLHACLYATYLKLQFYKDEDIRKLIFHLYSSMDKKADNKLCARAIERALRLDDDFVQVTNPTWQKKHISSVISGFGRGKNALLLPEDPRVNYPAYLWAERWFEAIGL